MYSLCYHICRYFIESFLIGIYNNKFSKTEQESIWIYYTFKWQIPKWFAIEILLKFLIPKKQKYN